MRARAWWTCFALLGCHNNPAVTAPRAPVTDGVVDIAGDGRRPAPHIHCAGEGTPVVVLHAGLGADGSVWNVVLADPARTTRACNYDRAGMGYSVGPAPRPHTNRAMARELHALL